MRITSLIINIIIIINAIQYNIYFHLERRTLQNAEDNIEEANSTIS